MVGGSLAPLDPHIFPEVMQPEAGTNSAITSTFSWPLLESTDSDPFCSLESEHFPFSAFSYIILVSNDFSLLLDPELCFWLWIGTSSVHVGLCSPRSPGALVTLGELLVETLQDLFWPCRKDQDRWKLFLCFRQKTEKGRKGIKKFMPEHCFSLIICCKRIPPPPAHITVAPVLFASVWLVICVFELLYWQKKFK